MNKSDHQTSQQYASAYLRLKTSLVGFLRSRLDDPSVAEDIVHEVFLKALLHSAEHNKSDIKNIDAWLRRIVRNALVDYYRNKQQSSLLVEDDLSLGLLSESSLDVSTDIEIHHLFAQFIRPFIECLPSHYSEVLISKEYEGKTVKEIAKQLNLSESAIKSRLSRGRRLLQEQLMLCCEIELDSGIVQNFTPRALKTC